MKIRAEQLQALEADARHRQTLAIADILRHDIPRRLPDIPDELFHRRIRYAYRVGFDFLKGDLRTEADGKALMLWIRLTFEVGPGFMRHRACRAVLGQKPEPPPARVYNLLLVDNHIPWEALMRDPDVQTWPAELA